MKKRHLLVIALLVVAISLVIAVPSSACTEGCTPGYWKQPHHLDSWVGYSPDDLFSDVFGVGPDITLLDALWARGGGVNALQRHAVAALLNAAHPGVDYLAEADVIRSVQESYPWTPEQLKDWLEGYNKLGCPLN
jgi:hypothetical protein